jgi:anti-sigma regulatory factor (Ser/Thr protein kinase)
MGTNGSTVLAPLRQGLPPIDPSGAAGAASCSLPARYEAVRTAREFTRTTLGQWGLDERFDDVALVVSELVTNALRHAVPDAAPTGQGRPVRLHLMRWNTRLVCAVRDPSRISPEAQEPDDECAAESGRGLFLVESFSDTWGWHPLEGTLSGKVVWAVFLLRTPEVPAGALPGPALPVED